MILIKYATKSSQTAFPGCTSHNLTYYPTVAENNVTHVTLSAANAANIPVGSTICIGAGNDGNCNTRCLHSFVRVCTYTQV